MVWDSKQESETTVARLSMCTSAEAAERCRQKELQQGEISRRCARLAAAAWPCERESGRACAEPASE